MNLNDDIVYRCLRLGPLHQRHPGRSRSLVSHDDRLHRTPLEILKPISFAVTGPERLTRSGPAFHLTSQWNVRMDAMRRTAARGCKDRSSRDVRDGHDAATAERASATTRCTNCSLATIGLDITNG